MKNQDIIYLVRQGVLAISNHTVSAAQAYKVFKFKKWLKAAFEGIQESEAALLNECGIGDAGQFDARLTELRGDEERTCEEQAELKDMEAKLGKFIGLRNAMYEDEVPVEGIKAMPYEEWFLLQNENSAVEFSGSKVDVLSGQAEEILEGVLWVAPEEE